MNRRPTVALQKNTAIRATGTCLDILYVFQNATPLQTQLHNRREPFLVNPSENGTACRVLLMFSVFQKNKDFQTIRLATIWCNHLLILITINKVTEHGPIERSAEDDAALEGEFKKKEEEQQTLHHGLFSKFVSLPAKDDIAEGFPPQSVNQQPHADKEPVTCSAAPATFPS